MPERAHTLIVKIGADTKDALIGALRCLETDIAMDQLTAGCSGGSSWGSIYAYRHDPAMTHDEYFRQLEASLQQMRPTPSQEPDNAL